jgi:hypothetical protein
MRIHFAVLALCCFYFHSTFAAETATKVLVDRQPQQQNIDDEVTGSALVDSNIDVQAERAKSAKPTTDSNPKAENDDPDAARERVIMIHHPNAAKGLIRINEDKSYQYKLKQVPKTYANSYSLSYVSPPSVTNVVNGKAITYQSMYGGSLFGLVGNYEWMPVRKFGTAGLIFETGISMAHGNGILASTPPEPALETYTILVIPLTVMAKYRFEYARHQFIVPYVEGGGTYYGLAELRSDGSQTNIAGSEAIGGGGGLAINISGNGTDSYFHLNSEFGVSDLWLNLEARAMVGLKPALDFTNDTINLGITVDY